MCAESAMGRGVQICVCPCFQQCQASHTYSISILIGMEKTDSYSITDGLARDDAAATILIFLITMNNITQFQCLSNNIVFFINCLRYGLGYALPYLFVFLDIKNVHAKKIIFNESLLFNSAKKYNSSKIFR